FVYLNITNQTYYWAVKTIDASHLESNYSAEQTYPDENNPESSPSPSSSISGGGGGGAAAIIAADASEKNIAAVKTHIFTKIEAGATPIATLDKPEIAISEIKFEAAKSLANVEIKVSSLKDKPTVMPAADKVYQYLEIVPKNLKSTDMNKATISFKVTKYWLNANGFKESDVVLSRYASNVWTQLSTNVIKSDADDVRYNAETPGFSYFAIVSKVIKAESKAADKLNETDKKKAEISEEKQNIEKKDVKEEQPRKIEAVDKNKIETSVKQGLKEGLVTVQQIIVSWSKIILLLIVVLSGSYAGYRRYSAEQVLEMPKVETQQEIIAEQSDIAIGSQTTQKVENAIQQIQTLPPVPQLAKKSERQKSMILQKIAVDIDVMENLRKKSIKRYQEHRLRWMKRAEMPVLEKKPVIKPRKEIENKKTSKEKREDIKDDIKKQQEIVSINAPAQDKHEFRKENKDISKKKDRIALFKILQLEKKIFEVHGLYSLNKLRDAKALYNKVAAEYETLDKEEKKRVYKPIVELNKLLRK
ncbi:PGF-pre-PGF domain-containing protein, partial [Candidatus Woesearchaeota archaeon]|nr:PGF-pre-PGF domain-containing protein [Candidatus Woesearchaeota archaeon]